MPALVSFLKQIDPTVGLRNWMNQSPISPWWTPLPLQQTDKNKCFQSLAKAIRDVWSPLDGLLGLLRHLERPTHRGQRLRRPKGKDSRLREAEQCGPGHGKGEWDWKMYDGMFLQLYAPLCPQQQSINFLHVHSSPTKLQWQNKLSRFRHDVKFEFTFIIDLLEISVSLTI